MNIKALLLRELRKALLLRKLREQLAQPRRKGSRGPSTDHVQVDEFEMWKERR
jgi:hypothetical protein